MTTSHVTRDRASLRFGWTLLFFGALAGTALELAHAFKLAVYLDDPLTRLLLTLAHAHAVGLALAVLAQAYVGVDPRPSTGRLLRVGALLLPLGFALGAIAHPESDPSIGIVLAPLGALLVLVALARLAYASWR
jgi:hypothetical protein